MTAVLAVVGPTASGKTALAIELAERLGTEVISADSMQVYRGMEIGTAAPTANEQARAPHHFVGILEPDEQFTAGRFGDEARAIVERLNREGRVAVVVGGSGLYVRALIDGLFPGPGKDSVFRERLQLEADLKGVGALYTRLREVDPDYAAIIQPTDLRRIIRGLEVYERTGTPLSKLHREHRDESMSLDAVQVALNYPRQVLYDRIDARVDRMLEAGFVDEVKRLLEGGRAKRLFELRTLGYREFAAYLRGEQAFEEAREAMKRNTRRFAKRQLSWFRADPRIHWLTAAADSRPEAFVKAVLDRISPADPHPPWRRL